MTLPEWFSADAIGSRAQGDPETLSPMQLDKYLRRINIRGEKAARLLAKGPTLSNLRLLIAHHLQTVTFENIALHTQPKAGPFPEVPRKWIPLSVFAALRKIVDLGRGGFCFELNFAFALLLRSLGYTVRLSASQVASLPFPTMIGQHKYV
eukprot:comp5134_c0_seq1/m.1198 comp5134_c0_seq1/g.1198  ORF comp5134_c0_seq1/g.1198 comp5134_c0_seq1/m.1198 type:complete len:151 (-) comp5134_c0_seq1:27-479(-)